MKNNVFNCVMEKEEEEMVNENFIYSNQYVWWLTYMCVICATQMCYEKLVGVDFYSFLKIHGLDMHLLLK